MTVATAASSLKQGTRTATLALAGNASLPYDAIPSGLFIAFPCHPASGLCRSLLLPPNHSVSMLNHPLFRESSLAVVVPFESPSIPSIGRLIELIAPDLDRVNPTIPARTRSQ